MRQWRHGRWLGGTALAVAVSAAGLVVGPVAPASAIGTPTRFADTSAVNADPTKTATVACPGASRVFATGVQINGGNGAVVPVGVVPNASLTAVTAYGRARPGFTGNWSLTVYAVCDGAEVAPQRVEDTSASSTVTVACPAGTRLFGTGFALEGGLGLGYPTEVRPNADLTELRVSAGGSPPPGTTLTAYGICHPTGGMMALRLESAPVPFDGTWPKTATLTAPGSIWLYGAGGLVSGPTDVFLDALVPDPANNQASARAVRASAIGGGAPAAGMAKLPALAGGVAADDGELTANGQGIGTIC